MTSLLARKKIISDLRQLGINEGDIILVHSSFKSLGDYDLNPEIVISALLAAVAPNGTLLMPALSHHQIPHEIHRTNETLVNVGALPEYFRTRTGTIRSIHPTHSVCGVGPAVPDLFAGHENDATPCGPFSPFRKILEIDAKIVMLGCGLRPNTTMHAIEELIDPPNFLGQFCDYQITTTTGKRYTKRYQRHGFQHWIQRYDRIELLDAPGLYSRGPVLDAETFVINTQKLKKEVLGKLKVEPFFFVERRV